MSVIIPESARPTNLHFGADVHVQLIDSDLYHICERLREISPSLSVVAARRGDEILYNIMETCPDGLERRIFKAKHLDGRVLKHIEKIMGIPFEVRFEEAAKEVDRFEEAQKEEQLDELYERLGRPMWTQLEHDGFIETRSTSYPKRGVKAGTSE